MGAEEAYPASATWLVLLAVASAAWVVVVAWVVSEISRYFSWVVYFHVSEHESQDDQLGVYATIILAKPLIGMHVRHSPGLPVWIWVPPHCPLKVWLVRSPMGPCRLPKSSMSDPVRCRGTTLCDRLISAADLSPGRGPHVVIYFVAVGVTTVVAPLVKTLGTAPAPLMIFRKP